MEQFRQIGEVLGSLKALMVFRDEIRVNQRQCGLLVDAFNLAFEGIAEEIKQHLRFEEKVAKWKPLEHPLRELHRVFREGEQYVRHCLEPREWWAKALSPLAHSTDCVELHLHNLLWCVPVVLEAIEAVGEITGCDPEDTHRRRLVLSKKYEREWMEPRLFTQKFGRAYLVSPDMCGRLAAAWKEDRWILSEAVAERRSASGSKPLTKQENRLAELLLCPRGKLHPASALVGSPEYQVRRRFGSGGNYKEVQWMGESFAVKHVVAGELEPLTTEIALLSSLAHPNVMSYLHSFYDEEKKECFLLMELMSKDLSSHIKEMCSAKRRVPPFSLLVAVDAMLQIARGMEYLHSRKIYHGDLNPSNILVKMRSSSPDGYLLVKIAGLGQLPVKNSKASAANQAAAAVAAAAGNPCIWYAPEVLLEQERLGGECGSFKCTEKADVYSFGMICFELLTGKIPFEDNHLQGDKMSKNIRAGERPLFPFQSQKYLTALTRKCWQADPSQRPGFLSICNVLRYVKRFLVMNPDNGQPDPPAPPMDYFDLETSLSKRCASWAKKETLGVTEIPFQMYAYRVIERERTSANVKDKSSESGSSEETTSACGDENGFSAVAADDTMSTSGGSVKSAPPQITPDSSNKRASSTTKKADGKTNKLIGNNQKTKTMRPPNLSCGRSLRMNSEAQLQQVVMSPGRRRPSGHSSD